MPPASFSQTVRVAHLNPHQPTELSAAPDAEARSCIAAALDLIDLPEARLTARIAPRGSDAWELTGRLTARVVQPCVVTLAPVTTAIAEDIRRVYSPHAAPPDVAAGSEVEMPDDEIEPLGASIDLGAVLVEALALALPLYPRAEGAALPPEVDPDNGRQPDADADADPRRPFAGLADLLARKETD